MRRVNNLQDVQVVLNGLLNRQTQQDTSAGNGKGRQIKDVGAGTEPDDVVTVAQLHSAMQPPAPPLPAPPAQQTTSGSVGYFGRAILPGVQVVATDVLAQRYRFKIPRDSNNNPIYKQANLLGVSITAKVLPVTIYSAAMFVSLDGVNFNPMFGSDGISLPGGQEYVDLTPAFLIPTLTDGNEIRVDVLIVDGTVSGIEILLQGTYS